MNAGQVYVPAGRAGLVAVEKSADDADGPDRKVYALTPDGRQRGDIAGAVTETL
jgi:hypothetical protein